MDKLEFVHKEYYRGSIPISEIEDQLDWDVRETDAEDMTPEQNKELDEALEQYWTHHMPEGEFQESELLSLEVDYVPTR